MLYSNVGGAPETSVRISEFPSSMPVSRISPLEIAPIRISSFPAYGNRGADEELLLIVELLLVELLLELFELL